MINNKIILSKLIQSWFYNDDTILEVSTIDTNSYNFELDDTDDKLLQDICSLVKRLHQKSFPNK